MTDADAITLAGSDAATESAKGDGHGPSTERAKTDSPGGDPAGTGTAEPGGAAEPVGTTEPIETADPAETADAASIAQRATATAGVAAQAGRTRPSRLALTVRIGALAVALFPLLWLLVDLVTGRLSANPIEELQQRTGDSAVIMLLLTLAVTPSRRLLSRTGADSLAKAAAPLRRTFGLFTAFYAVLHFLVFLVLDYGLRLGLIVSEFPQKPFILAGAGALLILVALAITSTRSWKRRLGPWWRRVHRLVYPATLLVALHYLWALKAAAISDLVLLGLLFAVLTLRLFTLHSTDPDV